MFEKRRNYLRQLIHEKQMDGVLIDSPSNLYYYTGFTGGEAMFFMPVDGEALHDGEASGDGQESGYIITDSRYYEQVEKECPGLLLLKLEQTGYGEAVKGLLDRIYGNKRNQGGSNGKVRIALEDTMNLARYMKLCEACKAYSFEPASDSINTCRMVKDDAELARLAKAEAIGDAAFSYILDRIKPGITEAEIALELEFYMKRQGASRLSFDTIAASGPNSSMPHAQVTNRRVEKGDFVTMDFGCVYQGYCSDMTRTVAVGTPTEEMKKVYQIVLDANLRAMDSIREGVRCSEIDAVARDYIRDCGYGAYFGHGLGHGVGLDIHEEPRFSPKCDVITRENMVITDEPGIYLPGRFGVRIEDLVVVKKDGFETLSRSDKKLIIL
jgi:Xaa-Pro aminopeptidase